MKKKILALVLVLALLLTGCGNVLTVRRVVGDSDLYSRREIRNAMGVVTRHFALHFRGCTLLEIAYDEEKTLQETERRAENGETGDVMVLTSSFYVADGDGSLNPHSTYNGWSWELERNGLGGWKLTNWGYG